MRALLPDLLPPWLRVTLPPGDQLLSWAIVNGGRRPADAVVWLQVRDADLSPELDAAGFMRERLAAKGWSSAVGFLTSRPLDGFVSAQASVQGVVAEVVVTVGLGNALRVGDAPGAPAHATINILCRVSQPLQESAALEALSIVVEARTTAVREADFPSSQSGRPATGTGTDCVALAWPTQGAPAAAYAGKHTALGAAIGQAVLSAVGQAVKTWLQEHACRPGD